MNRKDEHLQLANQFYQTNTNDFDKIRFIHQSLSNADVNHVNLTTEFLGIHFSKPFYINAMTGGSTRAKEINEMLAQVAKKANVLIASGSVSAALKDSNQIPSFRVLRENNPNGKIFANIGADRNYKDAIGAIQIVKADGLQVHLNTAQELVMPEGGRQFSSWEQNIKEIVEKIDLPVIVKEVGFGMSKEVIQKLLDLNVKAIDISGRGGTNFAKIENARNPQIDYSYMNAWGQSSVESLLEASEFEVDVLASGGVRNALDIVKALFLGAKSVGISGAVLHKLTNDGVDETIQWMKNLEDELRSIFTLLNVRTIDELQTKAKVVFSPDLVSYAQQRKIDLTKYS
ncbi:MAG: type 2 isopentenyl-diphosphate Delta-isomerase [Streptococcaceae bacterium]|jgi:isopentenyl-diphosphate delta-isomerase|nr:type 2 isopentenyl-diphosphate Delta-isomerase [Streptococcaceae bacterium]